MSVVPRADAHRPMKPPSAYGRVDGCTVIDNDLWRRWHGSRLELPVAGVRCRNRGPNWDLWTAAGCPLAPSLPPQHPHVLSMTTLISRRLRYSCRDARAAQAQGGLPGGTPADHTRLSAQGAHTEDLPEILASWLSHEPSASSFPWSAAQALGDKHLRISGSPR